MATLTIVNMEDQLYVPLHSRVPGGDDGKSPVGTVSIDMGTVGDATGGLARAQLKMRRIEFGFRPIIVPTLITVQDNLAAVGVVEVEYSQSQWRLGTSTNLVVTTVAGPNINQVSVPLNGMVFEVEPQAVTEVLLVSWATNTDTKIYHCHIFGAVFDAEVIEQRGSISELLAGVR